MVLLGNTAGVVAKLPSTIVVGSFHEIRAPILIPTDKDHMGAALLTLGQQLLML